MNVSNSSTVVWLGNGAEESADFSSTFALGVIGLFVAVFFTICLLSCAAETCSQCRERREHNRQMRNRNQSMGSIMDSIMRGMHRTHTPLSESHATAIQTPFALSEHRHELEEEEEKETSEYGKAVATIEMIEYGAQDTASTQQSVTFRFDESMASDTGI
jgi:hypothetical protein